MRRVLVALVILAGCTKTPGSVSERDMQGVFHGNSTLQHRELIAEFLPDGRFGGDLMEVGGTVRTQGYWRIGAIDPKRVCTTIETRPQEGSWHESYCASVEGERTALNCEGEGKARTCLMERRAGMKPQDGAMKSVSIPVE